MCQQSPPLLQVDLALLSQTRHLHPTCIRMGLHPTHTVLPISYVYVCRAPITVFNCMRITHACSIPSKIFSPLTSMSMWLSVQILIGTTPVILLPQSVYSNVPFHKFTWMHRLVNLEQYSFMALCRASQRVLRFWLPVYGPPKLNALHMIRADMTYTP